MHCGRNQVTTWLNWPKRWTSKRKIPLRHFGRESRKTQNRIQFGSKSPCATFHPVLGDRRTVQRPASLSSRTQLMPSAQLNPLSGTDQTYFPAAGNFPNQVFTPRRAAFVTSHGVVGVRASERGEQPSRDIIQSPFTCSVWVAAAAVDILCSPSAFQCAHIRVCVVGDVAQSVKRRETRKSSQRVMNSRCISNYSARYSMARTEITWPCSGEGLKLTASFQIIQRTWYFLTLN